MKINWKDGRALVTVVVGIALTTLTACGGGDADDSAVRAAPTTPPATAELPTELPTGDDVAAGPPEAVSMAPAGSPWAEPEASVPAPGSDPAPAPEEPARETETSLGPALTFVNRVHDFGSVWDVGKQDCKFEFTNTGDAQLVISEIKASCGCTATQLEKKIYEPGEGAAIDVEFSPAGNGRQSKSITVLSNSQQGAIRLTISAEVKAFVEVEPASLSFGDVAMGREHTRILRISSRDPNLEIQNIRINARAGGGEVVRKVRDKDLLSARIVGGTNAGLAAPGAEPAAPAASSASAPPMYEIEVKLHDTVPWGRLYGSVSLVYKAQLEEDDEPTVTTKIVSVNATIYGELRADQHMFRISVVRPGDTFERKIRITRSTSEPFAILDTKIVRSSMPGIALRTEPVRDPGVNGYDVILSGDPASFKGTVAGLVRLTTDVPGEESLDLQFAGNVRDVTK